MQALRLAGNGQPLKVLCLGAHCDDIEIGCGATILRLLDSLSEVSVRWEVFSGSPVRQEEARNSASDFLENCHDKEIILHDFKESFFPSCREEIKEQFELMKKSYNPAVIFTHYKADHHQDHRVLAELTWNTFRDHLILEYEIPKYEGDLGNPNVFVPISRGIAERKTAAILHHFKTQHSRRWFTADTFMAMMRLRGINANAPSGMAEAFHGPKIVL